MQVRMKIGPKTGEIVDLVYHAARTLVERGQAEDVDGQMRLPQAKVTRIDAVSIEGAVTGSEGQKVAMEYLAKKKRR